MLRKRVLALLLCLVMCSSTLVACANKSGSANDKGAYVTMYLTDEVYNFDPVYAYNNEEAESLVSLMFIRLFSLDNKGKLVYELVKEYEMKTNEKTGEVYMLLTLRDTWWSDKIRVTADDVVFAWKRILNAENSFGCASLLFDIKNARAVKAGNCSIDDLGIYALNDTTLQINFEKKIDEKSFLMNLTSLALAPLREDYVTKGEDWAKKPGTMVTSGAFKLSKTLFDQKKGTTYTDVHATDAEGNALESARKEDAYTYSMLVLERNQFYMRDPSDKDAAITKSVNPYRIIVDYTKTDEEIWQAYKGGQTVSFDADGDPATADTVTVCGDIFYMGSIPLSLRTDKSIMKKAEKSDALSTQVLYLNENALIKNTFTGKQEALFANSDVRQALSLALDREAIAQALVLAKAATALVPTGIYEKNTSGSFRKTGGALIGTSDDLAAAQQLLKNADIIPSDYTFSIVVNANDEDLMLMAQAAVDAWNELGFRVSLDPRGTILNNDYYAPVASVPTDLCDELYHDNLIYGEYEVIALDYCAYTADAYSMLAPLATDFSGMVDSEFNMVAHSTGYNSEEYNALIEAVYYLPYYSQLKASDYQSFVIYDSEEAFQAVLDRVAAVYEAYGIDPNKNVASARATLLHKAEELLMKDMPVIPVVFNQNATIGSKQLKNVSDDLYTSYDFEDAKLKNYTDYLADFELLYSKKKLKEK